MPTPEPISVAIPGPLRSFLRMAGISQKVRPEEVTPLLARNVFLRGFQASRPTEFLILLSRYVQQARELAQLAGQDAVLRASTCDDAKPLLKILGYRTRADCGTHGSYLETSDAQRAFITIDSGFPLPVLEKSLEERRPFAYPFPTSRVPALSVGSDWPTKGESKDLLDMLLRDPLLGRFYWALARMDVETQDALRQSPAFKKMVPFAAVLDFYGTHIRIRGGRVIVPGGSLGEPGWKDLVSASPEAPGEFVLRLISKDNGWLAAYFESLSRMNYAQQMHFTQPRQLRRFYEALRGRDTSPAATSGVFRPDSGLVLLAARVKWEPDGNPRIPGNLDVWKQILRQKSDYKLIRQLGRQAKWWHQDGQLLEALFAMSRLQSEAHPLQAYLMFSELDDKRPREHRLRPETVSLLAAKFAEFSDQYLVFSEFPSLDDTSIVVFLNTASSLTSISNNSLRGNALGTFQAILALWQILTRQGQIPSSNLNDSWKKVIKPFGKIASPPQIFDAGRSSLAELLLAVTGKPDASQDRIIDLLAGPSQVSPEGQSMHEQVANRIRSVLDEQRLVSLDTILTLGDALHEVAHVKTAANALIPLAQELRGFEMPQPIFRNSERDQWAGGIYNNHHTELQMRTDLVKIIKAPRSSEQLALARGQLAPFLRDTLVGLTYAYYEPPGAQILHHNPLFVRSHDFSGETIGGLERVWQAPRLFGVGSPAGGGAHLVGSLADLPYVLATTEQDFIAPENVQALIWQEVVPGLLVNAVIPRWWGVSRNELHAVALYQQAGEELLEASVQNEELRNSVLQILSDRMLPQCLERLELTLRSGHLPDLLPQLMPADTFYLAAEYQKKFPDRADTFGRAGKELAALSQQYPAEVSWERLSKDFGVPHPAFAHSYARELLNLAPFPAFAGYSSRLLAESWDSNNLYWARLADEKGYSPVTLNRLVPELTHRMIEKIFATDLEDWPALLRAERDTGDEFRQGKIASLIEGGNASSQPSIIRDNKDHREQ
ncbi:MAG TPA: hypothetical protein VOA41_20075 [Candidatus Dormibacteraeota bacterium]|nr:hypothetical protein [Candidatus Dormibacteraeota bacterium]